MEEMSKHGKLGRAAMKADMDRKTARKYVTAGRLPSELKQPRDWRTRADPFEAHWGEVEAMLLDAPGLEAKTLLEALQAKYPAQYEPGQLRTLQRRVRAWRAAAGPEKDVVLAQRHRPGEAMQTDFTHANELGVTIGGEAFDHLLGVSTLPYSNWRWATVCFSESMLAIRRTVQRSLFELGRVPKFNQTDHSTAATHQISNAELAKDETAPQPTRKRPFNEEYLALMRHFGMTPRTTKVGAKEQNGDVEASNGVLKRSLEQALLLRGCRDFESVSAWQAFIDTHLRKQNAARCERVAEELSVMRELDVSLLPEFDELDLRVSTWSTIRVKHCSYSLPSRLIGAKVRVRVSETTVEVYFGDKLELRCDRLRGTKRNRIDYRHVIWSLVKKPGAFGRYIYREEMFPSPAFRKAYDAISERSAGTKGDLEYLRILHLAASQFESDVEAALACLLEAGLPVTADTVKELVVAPVSAPVPSLQSPLVDLKAYDALLSEVAQ
jgi:hypothetical protein